VAYRKRNPSNIVEGVAKLSCMGAIAELGGGKILPPMHLAPLVRALEDAEAGRGRPTIVSVPPRHGKSTTVGYAIAWMLARHPDRVHAVCCYSQRLADRLSRSIRRITESAGIQFSEDENRIESWRTVEDGGLLAVGRGGPLTGFGISGVGIVDDPLKDREEAESILIRDATWDWLLDVFFTRLEPGATPFVVATRWHVDDPSGRLLAGQCEEFPNWNHIHLPAIGLDDAGNETALWPERWPLEALQKKRGPFGGDRRWHALYQGNPQPAGSSIFGEPTFGVFPGDEHGGLRIVA